jgi:serine phosphatase RsbU (regulator of sigma subunit)
MAAAIAPPRQWRTPAPPVAPCVAGVQAAGAYRASRSGGDFYDFLSVNGRVIFLLIDIASERDRALDIAAAAQAWLRTQGVALFAPPDLNENEATAELALLLNRAILAEAGGVCLCPAFLACYNVELGAVTYVNAGHTAALTRDSSGISRLPASGLPLGLFSHSSYEAQVLVLGPGAALVAVSRGLVETGPKKRAFGLEGVEAVFREATITGAQGLCTTVLHAVEQFAPTAGRQNDASVVALLRTL